MNDQALIPLNARQQAEQLLDLGHKVDTVRLLRHATEFDYVVPAEQIDAMQMLVNPAGSSLRKAAVEQADAMGQRERLQPMIASFARSFFDIPPIRREQQWQTLADECQSSPPLMRWLNNLTPALEIERVDSNGDEALCQLVDLCCQAYVARGSERARRRQEVIRMHCQNPDRWQAALRRLTYVETRFTSKVAPWLNTLPSILNLERNREKPLPKIAPPVEAPAQGGKRREKEGSWWNWFIVASIVSAVVRAIIRSDPAPDHRNPRPSYQQRQFDSEEEQQKLRDGARILRLIEEQRNRRKAGETIPLAPGMPEQPPQTTQPPPMSDQ